MNNCVKSVAMQPSWIIRTTLNDIGQLIQKSTWQFEEDTNPINQIRLSDVQETPNTHLKCTDRYDNWLEMIFCQIQQLCREKKSSEFTKKEFLSRFEGDLEKRWPNRKNIKHPVCFLLNKMVENNQLELLSKDSYRLLDENSVQGFDVQTSHDVLTTEKNRDPYNVDSIIKDGCFLPKAKIEKTLERLEAKKNIILQGPPGTGKTWLAKRLAFALIGQRNDNQIKAVQFHPNLSYEDFIRGWRPSGEGRLSLVDGPFMEMIKKSIENPEKEYVIVIEEINRGNPAQVFGEMLTLLETDKRNPDEALELSYKKSDGERVFIPENLYVVGTMNVADRSLALVDLALRRRFAFIDLEPTLGKAWQRWVHSQNGIDIDFLRQIDSRMTDLNNEISADTNLGAQFQVGHSYVTPAGNMKINNPKAWFSDVVATEIAPLLDEYWFDDLEKSQKAQKRLIEGL